MADAYEVMWRRVLDDLSFELTRIVPGDDGPEISGTVLIAEEGVPLRVEYRVRCDGSWKTREAVVSQTHGGVLRTLRLEKDGEGRWRRDGTAAPELAGCTDVDIEVSPSTNSLPINRLRLAPGASGTIRAAWIRVPDLRVEAADQSYERLGERLYRFRGLDSGFVAELTVDAQGLPVDYQGIWRRVAEGPAGAAAG